MCVGEGLCPSRGRGNRRSAAGGGCSEPVSRKCPDWRTRQWPGIGWHDGGQENPAPTDMLQGVRWAGRCKHRPLRRACATGRRGTWVPPYIVRFDFVGQGPRALPLIPFSVLSKKPALRRSPEGRSYATCNEVTVRHSPAGPPGLPAGAGPALPGPPGPPWPAEPPELPGRGPPSFRRHP